MRNLRWHCVYEIREENIVTTREAVVEAADEPAAGFKLLRQVWETDSDFAEHLRQSSLTIKEIRQIPESGETF